MKVTLHLHISFTCIRASGIVKLDITVLLVVVSSSTFSSYGGLIFLATVFVVIDEVLFS
jgi:hypothetical protein